MTSPIDESGMSAVWREGKVSGDAPDPAGFRWDRGEREEAADLTSVLQHNAERRGVKRSRRWSITPSSSCVRLWRERLPPFIFGPDGIVSSSALESSTTFVLQLSWHLCISFIFLSSISPAISVSEDLCSYEAPEQIVNGKPAPVAISISALWICACVSGTKNANPV